MTRHLAITTTLTLLALALAAPAPAAATSSSLLSGYGGPGQGSQAILGSTLLGGSSGGSPGSGSGSYSATTSATSTGSVPPGTAAPTRPRARHTSRSGSGADRGGKSSAQGASAYPASDEAAASRASTHSPSSLGLSGADILHLLLALGALGLIAVATGALARQRGGNEHG